MFIHPKAAKNPAYWNMVAGKIYNKPRWLAQAKSSKEACKNYKNVVGKFSETEWKALCEKQKNRCAICKRKTKLTADHKVPLTRGGCNYIFNVQALCSSCNRFKQSSLLTNQVSLFDNISSKKNQYTRLTHLVKDISHIPDICHFRIRNLTKEFLDTFIEPRRKYPDTIQKSLKKWAS